MRKGEKTPLHPQQRKLQLILISLTILTLANLLMTSSIVGFLAAIIILIMAHGIHKGNWFLTGSLSILLFVYAGLNFLVLLATASFGVAANLSALIWLGVYSALLILLGCLLRSRALKEYLKTAPQPEEKKKKIIFFKGGWRDL